METVYTLLIFALLFGLIAIPYWRKAAKHKQDSTAKFEKNREMGFQVPVTLHPHFDLTSCIGCASCVRACPEHVIGMVGGRPALINGSRCVGHALCADVCPVGAITMGFGTPRQGMEIPYYNDNFETNVDGIYIVGELGGIGLIKNAVTQGTRAVEHIATSRRAKVSDDLDLVIVGAGPAGLSAALTAQSKHLNYVVLEQGEIGGTVLHYPRQKLVLTNPVELPLYGRLKTSEISKEELLDIWKEIVGKFSLNILTNQKVEGLNGVEGHFVVKTQQASFRTANVILALGRRGSPRKLNVPGEDLTKVMYRLMEAESYIGKHILVVGGGDSAVEAAVGLANQPGNIVTISYRKQEFVRLKDKNDVNVKQAIQTGKLKALFNSEVVDIKSDAVFVKEAGNIIHNLQNDFVFIFAGGELPTELLKQCGVKMRTTDVDAHAAAA